MPEGILVVCATPIGNLGDVSARLAETLREADVVFAEDTRRTATLLDHVGSSARLRSLFVGNEAVRSDELVAALDAGSRVALVSDAGMPAISDPGARAVAAARKGGHRVTVVPGPSAVTSAVALAGFGGDRFVFEGFLPRKGSDRTRVLEEISRETRPVVLFVSPHRFEADMGSLVDAVGFDREVAVLRELTKLHEEVWVGPAGDLLDDWKGRSVKGEITVVLGPGLDSGLSLDEAIEAARREVLSGVSISEAARSVAELSGVPRRAVYEALISDQETS